MTKKVAPQVVAKYVFVIFWMALIFWLSGHDAAESSKQSGVVLRKLHESGATWLTMHEVRKIAHFLLYMILGISLFELFRTLFTRHHALYAILAAALYATTDEIHQLFITGRSSELRDVAIDTLGASVGVGMYYVYIKRRRGRVAKQNTADEAP
jgi:VanZ family protein